MKEEGKEKEGEKEEDIWERKMWKEKGAGGGNWVEESILVGWDGRGGGR